MIKFVNFEYTMGSKYILLLVFSDSLFKTLYCKISNSKKKTEENSQLFILSCS